MLGAASKRWVGLSWAALVWVSLPWMVARATAPDPVAQHEYGLGKALFSGKVDLQGRIYTHVADMPAAVLRCANCHAVADGPDVTGTLAPRLTHELLLRPRPRRGGPASNYDRDKFCTLLRRGIDPASVMISVEMPRYSISDAHCRALWRYVRSSHAEKAD